MQTAVAPHPDTAVPRLEHGVDLAQACLHRRPGLAIKLIEHISTGTPDIAFACLQKSHRPVAAKFLYHLKRLRLLVPNTQTQAGPQSQNAVLGGVQKMDFIPEVPVLVRLEK